MSHPRRDGCPLVFRPSVAAIVLAAIITCTNPLAGQVPADDARALQVCKVKLISQVEPDSTSVDTILQAIIKPGMSDEEKCLAAWKYVYDHRFWAPASRPEEFNKVVYDPIMITNCFPAMICQQDASVLSAMWAGMGYDVRYWQMGRHTTPEVFYGGKWRNIDPTTGNITKDKDGQITDATHYERYYTPGVSRFEPWDDYEIGHQMDWGIRRGESFTRYWSALSKDRDYWRPGHQDLMPKDRQPGRNWQILETTMSRKPYRIELAGVGYASGMWVFQPDFADGRWRELVEQAEDVVFDRGESQAGTQPSTQPTTQLASTPLMHPTEEAKIGELVLRVSSPYFITGAWLEGELLAGDNPDDLRIYVSTNNGDTWSKVAGVKSGQVKLALREDVEGTFGYLVKFRMRAVKNVATVGFRNLKLTTAVQVNPLTLPALAMGDNKIDLKAGDQTWTLTNNVSLAQGDFGFGLLEKDNVASLHDLRKGAYGAGIFAWDGRKESSLVYKMDTVGDIKRVRWGGRFKTPAEGGANEMYWSLDGKEWKKQEISTRWTFPKSDTPNQYHVVSETTEIPGEGHKCVYLKYVFKRTPADADHGRIMLASGLRMDVDYAPPSQGPLAPLKVTYRWAEGTGAELTDKTHTEVVDKLPHSYNITVGGKDKPLMKSVCVEYFQGHRQ